MTAPKPRVGPEGIAYMDGRFVDVAEASIPILDWGFLRSDATYDVVHVWKGRFFRLDRHIDRFLAGAKKLAMTVPVEKRELEWILHECVARSGHRDAYVEMICTRGIAPNYERHPRFARPRFLAFAIPFSWILPPERWEEGLHVGISESRTRIPPSSVDPTVKNYHWLDLVMGWLEVSDRGADTVLLLSEDGRVCEGAGFNLFAVHSGEVRTPVSGVLEGITRQSVIEICSDQGIACRATDLCLDDLTTADELFVTSTAGGVMPVTRLNGRPVGDEAPGPITRQVNQIYWERHADPAWSVPVEGLDQLP